MRNAFIIALVFMAGKPAFGCDPGSINYQKCLYQEHLAGSGVGNSGVYAQPNPQGGYDFSNGVSSRPNASGGLDFSNGRSCRRGPLGQLYCN